MLFIKLENLDPLLKKTLHFIQLSYDQIYLHFSPSAFSIIARFRSPTFTAVMHMKQQLFADDYSVDRNCMYKICLKCFYEALLEGQRFSSMTIHLLEPLSRILLRFERSRDLAPRLLHHELPILHTQEGFYDHVQLSINSKNISIYSERFKRILSSFSTNNEAKIFITSRGSQVKFNAFQRKDIVLSQEIGECLIGDDVEDEIGLEITFKPVSFFLNLANDSQRVWFSKTNASCCATVGFPLQMNVELSINFPQM